MSLLLGHSLFPTEGTGACLGLTRLGHQVVRRLRFMDFLSF